jgi:hypothetical protein
MHSDGFFFLFSYWSPLYCPGYTNALLTTIGTVIPMAFFCWPPTLRMPRGPQPHGRSGGRSQPLSRGADLRAGGFWLEAMPTPEPPG